VEVGATVEVFERENKKFHLIVEPRTAVLGLRRHLAAQTEEVAIFEPVAAGDIGVNLLNGKSIYEVLRGAASVLALHPSLELRQTDVQL
jgi:hypothetical protein